MKGGYGQTAYEYFFSWLREEVSQSVIQADVCLFSIGTVEGISPPAIQADVCRWYFFTRHRGRVS